MGDRPDVQQGTLVLMILGTLQTLGPIQIKWSCGLFPIP